MKLHDRISFLISGAKFKVIQPAQGAEVTLGTPFSFDVFTLLSDTVDVYLDSTKLATLTVENQKAEGTMTISSQWFTVGTIFKITEGGEVQVSNRYNGTLRFVSGEQELSVAVVLIDFDNNFDMTPDTSAVYWKPDYHYSKETNITPATSTAYWKPEHQYSKETSITPVTSATFEIIV